MSLPEVDVVDLELYRNSREGIQLFVKEELIKSQAWEINEKERNQQRIASLGI